MKRLIITVLLVALVIGICAQETRKYYVGTNPLGLTLAFPLQEDIKRYGPILAGNEYGFSLAGGHYFNKRIAIETRVAIGSLHQVARLKQLHAGILVHPFLKNRGTAAVHFYGALCTKIWNYHNRLTGIHFYHLSPYAAIGYQCGKNRWMVDLRLIQTLAVVSWTNLENTSYGASAFLSPWPDFIKVLPTFTCTIAYRFGKVN